MFWTHLNENGMCIVMEDKEAIDVSVKIQDIMKDLKFKWDISGLKGTDCILCYTKKCRLDNTREHFKRISH